MNDRRLVGIDLGIASAHTVRVLDGQGTTLTKRKALPTVESLTETETAALAGTSGGTRLEVVLEPTGPAWLPIAVFFITRGHLVYRVGSAESADLRRYLSKHAKTNGIDADTLARIPMFTPPGSDPWSCPASRQRRWHAGSGLRTG
jgi:Transposase